MRLLIVEDHGELAELMAEHLSENGYACDVAADGEEADLKVNDNTYDAILLDLNLPDVDGFDPVSYTHLAVQKRKNFFSRHW